MASDEYEDAFPNGSVWNPATQEWEQPYNGEEDEEGNFANEQVANDALVEAIEGIVDSEGDES